MIKYDQLMLNHGKNGEVGDCLRTAIACILEINPLYVPHFVQRGGPYNKNINSDIANWLAKFGMGWGSTFFYSDFELDEVLDAASRMCPGVFYLVSGKSPSGAAHHHTVVACGDEVVHDPHPNYNGVYALKRPDSDHYWEVNFILHLEPQNNQRVRRSAGYHED